MAAWDAAYVNNLPDSAFGYVAPGGSKDGEGKTVPRSLRSFPYKDSSGKVDLPHVRNALARLSGSNIPASAKASLKTKFQGILGNQGANADRFPPRENLVRAVMPGAEFREEQTDDGRLGTLHGHFARFGEWAEIDSLYEGHFMEQIAPGAFDRTIATNRHNMKVLFNHGKDPQVGDKPLGPIERLEADSTGAAYEVALLDTSYNRDLLPALKNDLYGASFRFKVIKDEYKRSTRKSSHNPDGLPERTITEMAVREFGPVTFPAYEGATAGVRSMTDDFLLDKLLQDPRRLRQLLSSRVDSEDLSYLGQMIDLATCYIEEQDEPGDAANVPKMEGVLSILVELAQYEVGEDEGDEAEDEMASDDQRSSEDAPPTRGNGHRIPLHSSGRRAQELYGARTRKKGWEIQ